VNLSAQPEYVHVVLNHLPIVGLAVAIVVLIAAVLLRNRAAALVGLALVAVLTTSVWPVMESGESAYNRIRAIADADGAALLKEHMLLADRWGKLYYLTALAALTAVVIVWRRPEKLRLAGVLVTLLALASLVAGVAIARLGGEVRHPEFRPGSTLVPSVLPAEHNHEHDHEH
jgi:hypothetical protein